MVCRWGGGSNSEGWRAGTMTACNDKIGLRTTKQQPTNEWQQRWWQRDSARSAAAWRRQRGGRGGSGSGGGSATARGRRQLGGGSAVAAARKRDVGSSLAAARRWRQRDSATFVSLLHRCVAHLAMITGDDNRDSDGTDRATIATLRGRIATTTINHWKGRRERRWQSKDNGWCGLHLDNDALDVIVVD